MRLDPLMNQLVRFKLHETAATYEATILAYDHTGYRVRGGSLSEYLSQAESCGGTETAFIEFKRIHWIQKVTA